MATKQSTVVVVGAGSFGASTALSYAKRNYNVILLEQFNVLDSRISSTDYNRIIRSDYRGIYESLATNSEISICPRK